MSVQIMIQHTLLAQYYTTLHNYCEDVGFPSPAPPMDQVLASWESTFRPAQKAVEGITCISRGRAIHASMASSSADSDRSRSTSTSGLAIRHLPPSRQTSQNALCPAPAPTPNFASEAREARMRIPSSTTIAIASPPSPAPTPPPEPQTIRLTPDCGMHLTPQSSYSAFSPAGPTSDYFQRTSNTGAASAANSPGMPGKKKPPPPPPPKRAVSTPAAQFAVALYGFEGQGAGDLAFREGDRIRIVKKTGSVDDWWEGELGGRIGSFPANYCRIG